MLPLEGCRILAVEQYGQVPGARNISRILAPRLSRSKTPEMAGIWRDRLVRFF